MDEMEFFLLAGNIVAAVAFFTMWRRKLSLVWPRDRNMFAKRVFGALPFAALIIILIATLDWASFDVIDSFTFVIFYIAMGYAFIFLGLWLMDVLFDISWAVDAVHNANKAAVLAVSGGFIALAIIYSGANIGDGPGWWCVVFASSLGFAAWFLLGIILHKITDAFERVTVERDIACGVRVGCYFIASAVILGRASAGDWTSAEMTVVEFMDGWPALPLMAMAAGVELFYRKKAGADSCLHTSIMWGAAFIAIAVLCVMFVTGPLPVNPVHRLAML